MKQHKLSAFLLGIVSLITIAGCSIEASYYTETVPSDFFKTQENVWQRFYRPFTHWKYYMAEERFRYEMSELGTDEICMPRRGEDWSDIDYENRHKHIFSISTRNADKLWEGITMGIAQAWDAKDDLEKYVDFEAFEFPEGTWEFMVSQLRALVAFYYLEGLDYFGGMPLYSTVDMPETGRSTDVETFYFIEELLDLAIPELPVKAELRAMGNGNITRATGAALKARLYFNANSYIGKEMYKEAADICRDIINGKYGEYELESDWTDVFGFNNKTSSELIWAVPSDNARLQSYAKITYAIHHYNSRDYFKNSNIQEGYNGICLVPSLDPNGNKYDYKLGNPFAKFEDTDIRKQPYAYIGEGKYRGMFLYGEQINPLDAADPTVSDRDKGICFGTKEYRGEVLEIVDQIARFSEVGPGKKYASTNELPSDIAYGEENSGVRLIKVSPMPNFTDQALKFNPYVPVIRLAEIYYTLAECEMRIDNNTAEAAKLINKVRERYFPDGDPNPVTSSNLDMYRMLDEWLIEFIGEERRRTDLIRWDVYANEDWWAHKATKSAHVNRYPLHDKVLSSNSMLKQNPGY